MPLFNYWAKCTCGTINKIVSYSNCSVFSTIWGCFLLIINYPQFGEFQKKLLLADFLKKDSCFNIRLFAVCIKSIAVLAPWPRCTAEMARWLGSGDPRDRPANHCEPLLAQTEHRARISSGAALWTLMLSQRTVTPSRRSIAAARNQ